MFGRLKTLASVLAVVVFAAATGCTDRSQPPAVERWATTENTNVKIDWDKVNEAYRLAEGPEDLERRVNEIYPGDEVISVAVHDANEKVQEVTGFFDKNTSGSVDEGEKIFTIKRELTGEGSAKVQTVGHGAYGYYASPFMTIATGMLVGSMLSRAFMPGYVPMYGQPYTTPAARTSDLRSHRNQYRAENPSRFQKASRTGRSYNRTPSRPFGGGRSGGGRFGIRREGRTTAPVRLTA